MTAPPLWKRHGLGAGVCVLVLVYLLPRWEGTEDDSRASMLGGMPRRSFCAGGLQPLADGACYAAPRDAPDDAALPLVIYLHGLFERGPMEDEEHDRQRRVARQATARGFAVLALRGTEGACHSEQTALVCWPSNERSAEKAPAFVEAWQPALQFAERRHRFSETFVLGFSNGGYFASLVAERALYKANAFVIAHAGPVEPVRGVGSKPPILLMSADEDISQEGMVQLDDELTRDDWPHEHYVRDGGHALPDSDIDAALTFFERTRTEPLPLRPPLSTRAPRARLSRHHTENKAFTPIAENTPVPSLKVSLGSAPEPAAPSSLALESPEAHLAGK
jgi:predicted esterase